MRFPNAGKALTAIYSYLYASASGSRLTNPLSPHQLSTTPPLSKLTVTYSRLQFSIQSSLTTIPWPFFAAFAAGMLSSVTQHGVGVALYDGYYSSPGVDMGCVFCDREGR
ncbi:hypothetical protein G7Y79_00032g067590 [Physcia stellaris]|nr:hypothetical protein G7Y79_00032g067590 [Physcia stellaris]